MKKFLLILSIISMAAISCADSDGAGGATEGLVTKNIPSIDKSVREGRANTQNSLSLSVSAQQTSAPTTGTTIEVTQTTEIGTGTTYNVLQRLYSTTWYQSEEDYDDGRLETEETFIFFNENSEVVEREYENGVLDGRDEYSTLQWVADIALTKGNFLPLEGEQSRNACIVRNTEKDDDRDTEFEAYFLYDENTLYIVDGDNEAEVSGKLQQLIKDIANNSYKANEDRYLLSKQAKQ